MLHLGQPSQHTSRLVDTLRDSLKSASEWPKTSAATPSNSLTGIADWSPDGLLLLTAATSVADDRKLRIWGLDAVLASSGTPSCTDLEYPSSLLSGSAGSLFTSGSGSGSGSGSSAAAAAVRLVAWPSSSTPSSSTGTGTPGRGANSPAISGADLYSSAAAIAPPAAPQPTPALSQPTANSSQRGGGMKSVPSSLMQQQQQQQQPATKPAASSSTKPLPGNSNYDGCITASHAGHLIVWDFRQPRGLLAPARLSATPIELALISPNASQRPGADHRLISVTSDMYLRAYDARKLTAPVLEKKLPGYVSKARVDAYGPLGPRVLVGYHGGLIEALALDAGDGFGAMHAQVQAQVGPCSVIEVDTLQRYVATSGQDAIVNVYDWETLEAVRTCRFEDDLIVRDLAFNHDGELLSVVSEGNTVSSFSVESGLRAFTTTLPINNSLARMRWHPFRNVAVATYAMPRTARTSKLVLFSP